MKRGDEHIPLFYGFRVASRMYIALVTFTEKSSELRASTCGIKFDVDVSWSVSRYSLVRYLVFTGFCRYFPAVPMVWSGTVSC